MKPLIIICGATCSGKTEISLKIANEFNSDIISADSRQIYKMLDVGTAKPTKDELRLAKHHFIDILNPDENYSAGKFGKDAESNADDIILSGKIPIVVGGSGLYIQALCDGFSSNDESDELLHNREILNQRLLNDGIDSLFDELFELDLDSALKYNDKNPRRIIRALEYYHTYNQKFSLSHFKLNKKYKTFYIMNNIDRDELYRRINLRSELMWNEGIIEETEKVLDFYPSDLNSLNTVGYKEVIAFLNGDMTKSEAIEKTKQYTRNYAKRQITWFKKIERINYYNFQNKFDFQKILIDLKKFFVI